MATKDPMQGALLIDRFGRPIVRENLTNRIAAANLIGARQAVFEGIRRGITPQRMSTLMFAADQNDPEAYMALAEEIEETDLHYLSVLGTRKRQVAQLPTSVDAASRDTLDKEIADAVQDDLIDSGVIDRYLFDMLDAVGKGFSVGEIIWNTDNPDGRWKPEDIEHVDPRFIRWDLPTRRIPRLLRNDGTREPLAPFKFIFLTLKAKSGIPLRGGLTRAAAWAWMFKNYTLKDWVQFCELYGMPIRVGKFPPGTSEGDQDALLDAVQRIGSDAAAIIPTNMLLEFVESGGKQASSDIYDKLCTYCDQQMSKAVLGQTGTTDSSGARGLGSGTEHTQVREDIERADAKSVATRLNLDLVKPYVDLNFGPQQHYPKLRIGREDVKDAAQMTATAAALVPFGLKVRSQDIRQAAGFTEPQAGDELLVAPAAAKPAAGNPAAELSHLENSNTTIAAAAAEHRDLIERAVHEQLSDWQQVMDVPVKQVQALAARCSSFDQFKTELAKLYPHLDMSKLQAKLASLTFQALAAGAAGDHLETH